eukprot:s2267_g2.t1
MIAYVDKGPLLHLNGASVVLACRLESAQIRAVTSVIESEYDRQIKVIRATGSANYTLITRRAKAPRSYDQSRCTIQTRP